MGFSYNVLGSMLVPLIVVLAIADDVHIMQHWDEERRHKIGGGRVQVDRAAPGHAAPRRERDDRFRHGLARDEQRRRRPRVRHGIGGRHHGRLHDLAGVRADAAQLDEAGAKEPPHEEYLVRRRCGGSRCSRLGAARAVLVARSCFRLIADPGMRVLHVDTNHINFFSKDHPLGQSAPVIDDELGGHLRFQIMLEGRPDSLDTPAALPEDGRLENELRKLPVRQEGRSVADYVSRVNQELHGGDDRGDVVPADPSAVAQELFVFTPRRRRAARAGAGGGQRLFPRADRRQARVDEFRHGPSARSSRRRMAHDAFRGTGIIRDDNRLGPPVQHARSLPGVSQISSFGTAFFTVFGVIFVIFRSIALRFPDHCAQCAAGARGARGHGVPGHLDEHRDRDGRQRRARRRRRRHDSFHQPLPPGSGGRRHDRPGDRDRHRARRPRVADHGADQQPGRSACCCSPNTNRRPGSAACSA